MQQTKILPLHRSRDLPAHIDDRVFAYEFDGKGNRLSQALNACIFLHE